MTFRQLDHSRKLLGRACAVRLLGEDSAYARSVRTQAAGHVARASVPGDAKKGRTLRSWPIEGLTLFDVLRYLVKLKRARWAVPSFRVTIRSRQLPAQDFEVVAWYV